MPRSSRHKSHRSHKHNSRDARERSDSEDDGVCRDRRQRVEEAGSCSGTRVSRDVEAEKRKSSTSVYASQEKDRGVAENGDSSVEHGRKRKDRGDGCVTPDRWNGSGKDDRFSEKVCKDDGLVSLDTDKGEKSRVLTVESKNRSSRRREASVDRHAVSSSRTESLKRRPEKEYSRKEIREDKEREIERASESEKDRERASERDRRAQDSRHEKSADVEIRNQGSRRGGAEGERSTKKDSTGFQAREDTQNADLEKEPDKSATKKGRASGGFDKWHDDSRNIDDKRLSSADDRIKNGGHKVEVHKDERYKDERYKDERHKDERYKDERYKDERHKDERYKEERYKEEKYREERYNDEKYRDKHYKDNDRDHKHRDIRPREDRSSRDYASDRLEGKSAKDRNKPVESYSKKVKPHSSEREVSPRVEVHGMKAKDNRTHRSSYDENDDHYGQKHRNAKETRSDAEKDASNSSKIDYKHQGRIDSSLSNNQSKSSISPNAHTLKDHNRRTLKQADHANREPLSDDRVRRAEDHDRVSVIHERVSDSLSLEKIKHRDRIKSDDRERQLSLENQSMENHFHNSERISVSTSPFKRTVNFSGSSPGHLLSQPTMRHGRDSPSVYEDDNRLKSVDRRPNNRYKRNYDPNIDRGQGVVTWKNGPTWPSPVPNGFIPFQPPPPGFHSGLQHFPPPSLFGARPYMEITQSGIPYHMHEVADRFTGHGHPFGWHHPADASCLPQMQGWDGSNPLFSDKSQSYVRPDWDPNRHLVGGRGWELNAEMWKGQAASMNAEFSAPPEVADDSKRLYSSLQPKNDVDHLQRAFGVSTHIKQNNNPSHDNSVVASVGTDLARNSLLGKKPSNNSLNLSTYLSRVEVSADLTYPELYKEIKNILTADDSTPICSFSMDETTKKRKAQFSLKAFKLCSFSETAADAVFKRAKLIYEQQANGRRAKPPPPALPALSKEESASSPPPPEVICSNETNAGSSSSASEPQYTIIAEMQGSDGNAERPAAVEREDSESITVAAGGDDSSEPQSDLKPDVVLVESPQACESIMPDCKVNLTRIHNPPESAH